MKKFFIKHSRISGIIIGCISFPVYLNFITKVLIYMTFGDTQEDQICGMGGLLAIAVLLLSMGISFIISILNGIYLSKYLNS